MLKLAVLLLPMTFCVVRFSNKVDNECEEVECADDSGELLRLVDNSFDGCWFSVVVKHSG